MNLALVVRKRLLLSCKENLVTTFYPFLTRPIVYLVSFALTLIFFSYRMANWILTIIHNSKKTLLVLSAIMIFFSIFDEGRYMLFSEVLLIITMAALFYPNSMIAYLRKVGNLSLIYNRKNRVAA